ncbi:MAG TPA: type II toxin-antitoxin system death-on-curing family toxin [Candidatus Chromulinivoraceae bacterium]|nr:type II toxin-antitoxin system death-on-curing family toxin [Candidatus Chromulinivoraceae bacterium]
MSYIHLTLEEILQLHFRVVEDFGGSHGVRDEKRLMSVVAAPQQEVFGQEQYPSLHTKAAVYLRNVIGDHPFSDGNKRTALTICGVFLARNGKPIVADPKKLEEFTVQIAVEHLDIETIAKWLKSHSA